MSAKLKTLSCNRTPPCLYLPTKGPWHDDLPSRIACKKYNRDEDWPVYDPTLKHTPATRTTLDLLYLMRNKTLLVAGDSVMQHTWYAIMCALERYSLAEEDPKRYTHIWNIMRDIGPTQRVEGRPGLYNRTDRWDIDGTRVWRAAEPYNVTLLMPRVNAFDAVYLTPFVELSDVTLTGFGLYYSPDLCASEAALQSPPILRQVEQGKGSDGEVREVSAQHFPVTGHYEAALNSADGGMHRGECEPLTADTYTGNANARINMRWHEAVCSHPNIYIVPFYNLTATRHNLHMGGPGPVEANKPRDCTHLCYTPLMWDVHFFDIYNVLKDAINHRRGYSDM
eukprot:jgi/Chlat1/6083/Chrsp4S06349